VLRLCAGIHNFLVYSSSSPFRPGNTTGADAGADAITLYRHTLESGPVMHGQELRRAARNGAGEFVNEVGAVYHVLHQYDRIGQMLGHFWNLYPWLTERDELQFPVNTHLPPLPKRG
jgi:hypothetical protein